MMKALRCKGFVECGTRFVLHVMLMQNKYGYEKQT